MEDSGYSKTPLVKKLGIKEGFKLMVINEPNKYVDLFDSLPGDLCFIKDSETKKDFIHFFTDSNSELEKKDEKVENRNCTKWYYMDLMA